MKENWNIKMKNGSQIIKQGKGDPMRGPKCNGEGCTNVKAWGFRDVGFWHGKSKNLCDECYGHRYGDHTCYKCEKGCFDEDMEKDEDTYLCGRCRREVVERERMT